MNFFNIWRRLWETIASGMASLKLNIEKFFGKNDFGLWKVKMRALLIQHGLAGALKPNEKEKSSTEATRLQDVNDKNLREQLDTFNRYVDDLEDIDVKLENDDKTLMLLNALPKSLENFKDAVLFGRQDQISYDDVLVAVKIKILRVQGRDSKAEKKTQDPVEGLNVKFKKGKKSFKGVEETKLRHGH
ncbi:hypothetical protein ACS0TY_028961 [Phlomoides rotata]